MLCRAHVWESRRSFASLVDRLRAVSNRQQVKEDKAEEEIRDVVDEKGEPFREFFVMPKRKLRSQLMIERATGRAEEEKMSRLDIHDRLALRRPRAQEMSPDQDWPSVWPVARSFASSVVPLPVRMGTRRKPENRAPFKKEGNLELVKIPNFLHLTPSAIERHCEALKQFCTEYPKELKEDANLTEKLFPITLTYSDYVHQGTSIRDMRARVITLQVKLAALNLDKHGKDKFIRLTGPRFKEDTDELTIITDRLVVIFFISQACRCYTRKQNLDYALYLLTALYHESLKVEEWEKLQQRVDDLKVLFEGSSTETRLVDTLSKIIKDEDSRTPLKELGSEVDGKKILEHPVVQQFVDTWYKYRNTKETEGSTMEYGARVRQLLGIPSVQSQEVSK